MQRIKVQDLNPKSVMLDDDMWLQLSIDFSCIDQQHKLPTIEKTQLLNTFNNTASAEVIERPVDFYEPVTVRWLKRKLSNFEYLMIINRGAGRTMIDPLYHPIMPWVTDFSCQHPTHGVSVLFLSS